MNTHISISVYHKRHICLSLCQHNYALVSVDLPLLSSIDGDFHLEVHTLGYECSYACGSLVL